MKCEVAREKQVNSEVKKAGEQGELGEKDWEAGETGEVPKAYNAFDAVLQGSGCVVNDWLKQNE